MPVLLLSFFLIQCEEAEKLVEDNKDEEVPYPTACFTAPDDIYVGVEATFSASCSQDAESYAWEFGDGSTASGQQVTHTFSAAGDYEITLTVSSAGGEDETSESISAVREDVVYVSDNITSDVTWQAGYFYIVTRSVDVDAVLTIEPGAIVKFEEGACMDCVDGRIVAAGLAETPIIFTSYRDDAGDDTNGDGNGTSPSPGDWGYIYIGGTNNASNFAHCRFSYGGGYNNYDFVLELASSSTTVANCTFFANKAEHYGALNASDAGENVTITGNTFFANSKPLMVNGYISLDDSNVFVNPDDANQTNVHNAVYYHGNYGKVKGDVTWAETDVPFVVTDGATVTVESGHSLTIAPGVVVKFVAGEGMDADEGLVLARGTDAEPIVFTSLHDDAFGGDTGDDGDQLEPVPGDWNHVLVSGTNNPSEFEHCHFYYGGGYYDYDYVVELTSNNTVVDHCTFAYNKGSNYGALSARSAGSATQITNNIFYSNVIPLQISGYLDMDDSNTFHQPGNPAVTNERNGIFVVGNWGEISGSRSWAETEVPFVFPEDCYDLKVVSGSSLTLAENVVMKFGAGRAVVHHNNLYNYNGAGVFFTSMRDDSRCGDTNGDGTQTCAVAGDWDGVYNDASDNYESWSNILFSKF